MYATLLFDTASNVLRCVCAGIPAETTMTYQLRRHSTVIDQSAPTTHVEHQWALKPMSISGDLHAKVVVHLDEGEHVLETEWQYVPSEATRSAYESWLQQEGAEMRLTDPEVAPANRPFESIAFIHFPEQPASTTAPRASLESVATRVSASLYSLEPEMSYEESQEVGAEPRSVLVRRAAAGFLPSGSYMLFSGDPYDLSAHESIAFGSGYAFDNGQLRRGSAVARALTPQYGQNARRSVDDPVDAAKYTSVACGDFQVAVWHWGGVVEFHTDYVGAAAWFVYRSPRLHIVASSFLLATEIARSLGEKLTLNTETVDVNFTSVTQAFQQPILDDLELSGFSVLRPDNVLIIGADGVETRELNQLGRDIAQPDRFTVRRYEELLDRAASELTANCEAIASDPEIDQVRCDITGGLDSRLVLAGFLNGTPETIAKVSLFTETTSASPSEDERVAVQIAAATGLEFSDRPITLVGPCSARGLAKHQLSASFGTYWHRGHGHSMLWDPTTAFVGGAGLGNFARDYTTGGWKLVAHAASAPEEVSVSLAQQVFKWRGRATMKASPHGGVVGVARSWDNVPGEEIDKGAQIFNFFRARFHGGASIPSRLGALRVSPGLTRSVYRLRLMAGRVLDGPHTQLGLLHRLNPSLAAVPFANPVYNETYAAMYGDARTDLVEDFSQLREAYEKRRAGQRWVPCVECGLSGNRLLESADASINLATEALRELGRDPELHELMLPAYRFAVERLGTAFDRRHSYSRTFVNKVLHLHAMWRMVRGI